MSKIAILGCGPSGLLAAHAAIRNNHNPIIYSKKVRSEFGGAQYLHEPIAGITEHDPDMMIRFIKIGSKEGYARKVYGSSGVDVSWTKFDEAVVPAWSMRTAYDMLWNRYSDLIVDREIAPEDVYDVQKEHDLTINTIPLRSICLDPIEHSFSSQAVILTPDAKIEARDVIVYNGQDTEPWYRTSNIGGTQWTEYSANSRSYPIVGERHYGMKPVDNDCHCHIGVLRIGRFGAWRRGILAHNAYNDAMEYLS